MRAKVKRRKDWRLCFVQTAELNNDKDESGDVVEQEWDVSVIKVLKMIDKINKNL
jgi:hypothetical protein